MFLGKLSSAVDVAPNDPAIGERVLKEKPIWIVFMLSKILKQTKQATPTHMILGNTSKSMDSQTKFYVIR